MANLAEALVTAGNNVTYVLPSSLAKAYEEDLLENGVNVFTYQTDRQSIFDNQTYNQEFVNGSIEKDIEKMLIIYTEYGELEYQYMRSMFNNQGFLSFVNESDFDMLILNMFKRFISPAILAYKFSIPFISVNTIMDPWGLRVPALPSFVPHAPMCEYCTEHMTFLQRLKNAYYHFSMSTQNQPGIENFQARWREQFPDSSPPTMNDVLNSAQLVIYNGDVLMGYPEPTMPNVILAGGLSAKPAKPLTHEFQAMMAASEQDFVVVSFGTVFPPPDKYITTLFDAFRKLPYIFLMKYNRKFKYKSSFPQNVKTYNWFPQNDLLAQAKVKLFINHCGNNGQMEALYHGVPMVCIPLIHDQYYNSQRMEYLGYGKQVDLYVDTVDTLVASINEVLTNNTYNSNIQRASQIYHERPLAACQNAVYWIEHVIKFGGKHLRSYGQDMPLYQFWMLDILLFCSCVTSLSVLMFTTFLCMLFKYIKSNIYKADKMKMS